MENTWDQKEKLSGFVVTTQEGVDMYALGIESAELGKDGKVIAHFGEVGGVYEQETISDLTEVVKRVNKFDTLTVDRDKWKAMALTNLRVELFKMFENGVNWLENHNPDMDDGYDKIANRLVDEALAKLKEMETK